MTSVPRGPEPSSVRPSKEPSLIESVRTQGSMALSLLRSDLRFQHLLRSMSFTRSAPFGLNLIRAKTMRAPSLATGCV